MRKNPVNNKLESVLLETGYSSVVGIDEVGRGCWAGPVVVAAFVYRKSTPIFPLVNDSKRLTLLRRNKLYEKLKSGIFSIGSATSSEIDEFNIVNATRLAIKRALQQLELSNFVCLVDGHFKEPFDFESKIIKKADLKHYSVAAASILAKVYRDNLMQKIAKKYPEYGFERHVGYGTRQHREALARLGVCDIHRRSYGPIRKLLNE